MVGNYVLIWSLVTICMTTMSFWGFLRKYNAVIDCWRRRDYSRPYLNRRVHLYCITSKATKSFHIHDASKEDVRRRMLQSPSRHSRYNFRDQAEVGRRSDSKNFCVSLSRWSTKIIVETGNFVWDQINLQHNTSFQGTWKNRSRWTQWA